MPMPISAILTDAFSVERRIEASVGNGYEQRWTLTATVNGRTRSIIGTWPKYKTNPANTDVFYCDYVDDMREGDRLIDASGTSLYVASIRDPGRIHHHLESQCFEMPTKLTYESYSAERDVIGGETKPTYTTYLSDIVARIDVPSDLSALEASKRGQSVQYTITIHATTLIDLTGRLSFVDGGGRTNYLRITTISQPNPGSPWMIVGAENWT